LLKVKVVMTRQNKVIKRSPEKKNVAQDAVAWYLGMWRKEVSREWDKNRAQSRNGTRPEAFSTLGLFISQDNKSLFVVEGSWTGEFCSLTLQESKCLL